MKLGKITGKNGAQWCGLLWGYTGGERFENEVVISYRPFKHITEGLRFQPFSKGFRAQIWYDFKRWIIPNAYSLWKEKQLARETIYNWGPFSVYVDIPKYAHLYGDWLTQ